MFNSLLPWNSDKKREKHPILALQEEMNRAFDNFFKEFDTPSFGGFGKKISDVDLKVNVTENKDNVIVSAELPGVDEKEIDLSIANNTLILKGEKKEEKEEKGDNTYYREISYGSFYREIPLHVEVDESKVDASFKNGVLTVKLPKTKEAQENVKKIEIKSS